MDSQSGVNLFQLHEEGTTLIHSEADWGDLEYCNNDCCVVNLDPNRLTSSTIHHVSPYTHRHRLPIFRHMCSCSPAEGL